MKRENFRERTTFSNTGDTHTFDPSHTGVVPEVWTISLVNIDTGDAVVTVSFFAEAGGSEFAQTSTTVAADGSFDETFETPHPLCKVKVVNSNLSLSKTVSVHCSAGPINGGVNSLPVRFRTKGASGFTGI